MSRIASAEHEDLRRTVEKIVAARRGTTARPGERPVRALDRALWGELTAGGFITASVLEKYDGGGDATAGLTIIRALAAHTASVPVLEHMWMAGWLLPAAGIALPAEPVTFGFAEMTLDRGRLVAHAGSVPWAGEVSRMALLGGNGMVALVPRDSATLVPGTDLARTPVADVDVSDVELPPGSIGPTSVTRQAAMVRLAQGRLHQIHAAGRAALELTLDHVARRTQFGRPLARFQAVQQRLALAVAELALLGLGSELSTRSTSTTDTVLARVDARRSVGVLAREVHQLFGATGVAAEHPVSALTSAMRAWLATTGPDAAWHEMAALACRSTDMWSLVVGESDV